MQCPSAHTHRQHPHHRRGYCLIGSLSLRSLLILFSSFRHSALADAAKEDYPRSTTGTIALEKDAAGKAVICRKDDLLSKVLKILTTEGFLGLPVLNDDDEYIGFIDMLDMVSYVCRLFSREQRMRSVQEFESFFSSSRRFRRATVGDVDVLYRENKAVVHPLHEESSLLHVLEVLVHQRMRRVPLVDSGGDVTGLITTSMMISTLSQNMDYLEDFCDIKVRDLIPDLGWWVDTINESSTAISAFTKMVDNDRYALPVVNDRGVIVDNISIRDLRGIGCNAERFRDLWSSVRDFKEAARKQFPAQTPFSPIVVTKDDTIGDVLRKMDDGNIHRVFVVADIDKPIPEHVISQYDVLKALLKKYRHSPSLVKTMV